MPNKRPAKSNQSEKKQPKGSKEAKKNTEGQKKNGKTEKGNTSKSGNLKMTLCTIPTVGVRSQVRERRPGRPPSGKRLAMVRDMPAKVRSAFRRSLDPCDNSNDSGLGFDHHADPHHLNSMSERLTWNGERAEPKRLKMDIKLENEDVNDRYCFPETLRSCKDSTTLIRTAPAGSIPSLSMNNNQTSSSGRAVPRCIPLSNRQPSSSPIPLTTQLSTTSKYASDVSLTIVKQPEQQHRARYQTEGSRGAVKDREGNGFPVVQLVGYYQPTTLQVFIGTDVGKVAPHMFYQACKVSGKNSTPCVEKKIDGTCVIELQLDPSKEMSATCDCVGILKERNVDVEHRFPDQLGNRSKKKSTRCRMIFRTTLTHDDGTQETLQVCSQPIVCTQPPGIPEICKKSLTSCPASGGLELFVLGKNFLKDTKVHFQQVDDDRHVRWEQAVVPDKEYLQQTHFVCVIPPYRRPDITEPVTVRLCVVSSGKTSEPHQFVYTPVNGAIPSVHVDPPPATTQAPFFNKMIWSSNISKREQDLGMMPPPESSLVPMASRRPSISLPSTSDNLSPPLHTLKQEYIDENSQSSVIEPMDHSERYRHISESSLDVHPGDSNMSMINENSIDMLSHNNMINNENSNLSVSNENSVEMMVRRGSISRSVCENSMDVNLSNSQMSSMNEDNSCSNVMQHCSNSVVTDRLVLSQPVLMHQNMLASAPHGVMHAATAEELKVMDLRMKMPMATVADLGNSSAPSMATLQSFGVTEANNAPLPAQSAQSVENFLTNIESKVLPNDLQLKKDVSDKINEIISTEARAFRQCRNIIPNTTATEPVYLSSQRPFLTGTTENESLLVAKSEAAAIAEQTISEQASAISSPITTISSIENVTAPINTEKLDQLVNSTVESHIGSPTRSESKDVLMSNKMTLTPNTPTNSETSNDVIRDVMLNSRSSLMVAPIINTTLPSPILNHDLNNHNSPNLSPAVILNSQISPSLMCRNTQDTLLPSAICQPNVTVESSLQPPVVPTLLTTNPNHTSPLHSPIAVTNPLSLVNTPDPEKVVLLKAAVDLLETQKKISELDSRQTIDSGNKMIMNNIMTISSTGTTNDVMPSSRLSQLQGNNFVQAPLLNTVPSSDMLMNKTIAQDNKSDFVIPVPVKEMTGVSQADKKNEDRMIPQSFTSLTENELINLINPSCFDQV
ncbi:nuclear factor of activated T-cells, cytoplasmic 3 isoform X2 [Tribolium madens]|uniref:nuclear factor of activated T-cells, cytoplasmic 3 isoform X2 n=1 Tax=Tribolium madens TaxID=41895 RepID=UPI001CF73721|nr:nuclear factor of activated T-cells, cytoplasmic 3 isoform X2 [Tribolium madens]